MGPRLLSCYITPFPFPLSLFCLSLYLCASFSLSLSLFGECAFSSGWHKAVSRWVCEIWWAKRFIPLFSLNCSSLYKIQSYRLLISAKRRKMSGSGELWCYVLNEFFTEKEEGKTTKTTILCLEQLVRNEVRGWNRKDSSASVPRGEQALISWAIALTTSEAEN